ncbi:MAG: ATP synthase F0 subunit B [Runella slithyformis]|jgi:F-type H+-transporting ATPase subunit b|nr:MAG: ATP synthase F0 subunit B [Runella slithyformis]TAF93418.1 MAG: ATP synthase F0 subunit B [Runella sp.]TAG24141.1 MAG: ATP synthase F0 subunit B [Cytophagales bacterium]TAG34970.1 MAG: ATP synthase F0 subunit B [Cytophagia bacterium]TAF47283.1 MAG: ATP synthase F0 subunit B [Runella slithyformis]
MELLTPAVGLLFWMVLVFLILFVILRLSAWKPILNGLKERETQIQSALDLAEKTRNEMAKMQADNQKLLAEARLERDGILKAARDVADKTIAEAKDKAQIEGKKLVEDAREAINNERASVVAQMRKEMVTLSLEIAEKVLRKELSDKPAQEKLVSELVKDAHLN